MRTNLLVLVLYSHTGWGYLLAQLLHGWPWLHYTPTSVSCWILQL